MAFSQSIQKGQTALICQLCENEPKIKWKCLQCKLMMCQRCRDKVHPKFPSAGDHTIIDIKDSRTQEEEPYLDFTKLKCPVHKGQNCCLFCKSCMEVVCPTCVAKTHKSHDLVEIREGYEIHIEKAKSYKTKTDTTIQEVSKGEKNLHKIKLAEKSKYNQTKQEICDKEKSIVKAAKKHKEKLLSKLDQKWDNLQKSIEKELEDVKKKQKKLSQQSEKVDNILQSKDPQKVFSSSKDLSSSIKHEKTEIKMSFKHIPNFVGGNLDGISSLFGSLDEVKTDQNLTVQVLDHYLTNLNFVTCMSVCPDNTIWIGDDSVIQHVKLENNSAQIISEIEVDHNDMTLLPSGDLLIATEESHLKLVKQGTSKIIQAHNLKPRMKIKSVHVTPNNNIIVIASDREEFSDDGSIQVLVMDQAGKTLKVHEYDRNGKPLFSHPHRVCSNSLNTIAVLDKISPVEGRIVVLDQEGEIINIYTGHPDVNSTSSTFAPFTSEDIVATLSNNFVISDRSNSTLHILNKTGEGITYCNIKQLIDDKPYSLAISETNHLYIGTIPDDCEDIVMIYMTDISGW